MGRWDRRTRLAHFASGLIVLLWLIHSRAALAAEAEPDGLTTSAAPLSVEDRLLDLDRKYSLLAEENRGLSMQVRDQPLVVADSPVIESSMTEPFVEVPSYFSGYDKAFFISPHDPEQFPFELKFNSQDQVRHIGFARNVRNWTDSAGIVRPVSDRSAFELTRGRAIFSGYAFDPNLVFNLAVDYTTTSDSQINFWNYWLGYQFHPGLSLFVGQTQVPGSREWLTPAIYTLGPDYSLATTFFRPSLSQGIWAIGEPLNGFHYRAMFSNGFNTLGTSPAQLDSRMTFSGSVWIEPFEEFGRGFSDFDWHDDPAVRVGTSFTYSPIEGQQGNASLPENSDIRLTDGTLITETGALAPGVTLNVYHVALGAIDLGFKYRGLSLSGEFYLRDLFNLKGDGPIPRGSIVDWGGFAQLGYFVLPQKVELYGRTSQITGPLGYGSEYAGGLNWFCLEQKQNLRVTLDVTWVNHSPADQARTDYRAGDTGLLVRSQVQFFF